MTETSTPGAAPAAPVNPPRRPWFTWPETRDIIAVMSTLLFAAAYGLPWLLKIPAGAEQNVGQMQGALILQWGGIMSWYFGSSKGSAAKDDTIAQMAAKDAQP